MAAGLTVIVASNVTQGKVIADRIGLRIGDPGLVVCEEDADRAFIGRLRPDRVILVYPSVPNDPAELEAVRVAAREAAHRAGGVVDVEWL